MMMKILETWNHKKRKQHNNEVIKQIIPYLELSQSTVLLLFWRGLTQDTSSCKKALVILPLVCQPILWWPRHLHVFWVSRYPQRSAFPPHQLCICYVSPALFPVFLPACQLLGRSLHLPHVCYFASLHPDLIPLLF